MPISPLRQGGRVLALLLVSLALLAVSGVALGFYALDLDKEVREKFEGKRWAIPAKVYARPLELYSGDALSEKDVLDELAILHYRPVAGTQTPGTFQVKGNQLFIHTRGFDFSDGPEKSQVLRLQFNGDQLADVASTVPGGKGLVRLEPLIIGGIYPKQNEDRVLMQLKDAPPYLIDTLLATEDRDFYNHHGVSVKGIARAMWVNVTHGQLKQGGSTLTQQLVKNFYLNDERSLKRKLNEAVMAFMLESHYSKNEILECYLNEVNLGQNGEHSVNGFGLAAQFYFGQPISELDLPQVALLVGLVKGPSYYNPRHSPAAALARRNVVIDNLYGQGKITLAQRDAAKRKPLGVITNPTAGGTVYPAFIDLVRRQLHKEYKEEDLNSEGLRIFTTLDPRVQNAADAAFSSNIQRLQKNYGKRMADIQGAVLVSNPENGELLAAIGGSGGFTGYNRALDAQRQVGSLFKPAVYLTALDTGKYTVVTPLDDSPVQLQEPNGHLWQPANYDNQDHGTVPLYDALAHSYNQATVRMGLAIGVPAVISTLQKLGIQQPLPNYPSLLLGAQNLAPLDVLNMYQTIAANGFQTPARAIREVVNATGKPLTRYGLAVKQVYDPSSIYLLNYAMQQVMRQGTGAEAYKKLPQDLVMAGKTGTTNDLRDAWFAGFTGNYLAVVWVGHDDNRPVGLTGALGALPVWVDLMAGLHPTSLTPVQPQNVQWQWADKATGQLSAETCEGALYVPFRTDTIPTQSTACATGGVPGVVDNMLGKVMSLFGSKPAAPVPPMQH
jgi:penicillin-binding protein 1B